MLWIRKKNHIQLGKRDEMNKGTGKGSWGKQDWRQMS